MKALMSSLRRCAYPCGNGGTFNPRTAVALRSVLQDTDTFAVKGNPTNPLGAIDRIVPIPIDTPSSFTTMSISQNLFSRNSTSGIFANNDTRLPYISGSMRGGMFFTLMNLVITVVVIAGASTANTRTREPFSYGARYNSIQMIAMKTSLLGMSLLLYVRDADSSSSFESALKFGSPRLTETVAVGAAPSICSTMDLVRFAAIIVSIVSGAKKATTPILMSK